MELRRRIMELNPTAGIIECIHHPLYLEDVFTGQRIGLDFLKNRKVASLERNCPAGKFRTRPGAAWRLNWFTRENLRTTIGSRNWK